MIPPTATVWAVPLDPYELLDYRAELAGKVLEPGETIDDFTVTLLPEASLLGVVVHQGAGKIPAVVDGTNIDLFFEVEPGQQNDPEFDGAGAEIGVVFSIETSGGRRRQRTYVLKVAQQ